MRSPRYAYIKIKAAFYTSLIGLMLLSCTTKKEEAAALETFTVTQPIVADTLIAVQYVADIHSVRNVELRSRVSGYLEKIHVDEGKPVVAGQLLFSINDQEYQQELLKAYALLRSAQAEAKISEVDLTNVKTLVEKNIVAKTEQDLAEAKFEAAKAKVEEAKATVQTAQLQLSFTQVRAPFSGVINRILNKAGSLIEEGALLTTLSDNSDVFAYFHVSETDYLHMIADGNVDNNHSVELIRVDNTPHPHLGMIETVEDEVDKSTGNIAFRARFKNPGLVLKHGSTGKVKINNEVKNALMIPQKSTFEIQDNRFVFVVDENDTVRLRRIQTAQRIPNLYVVKSGLQASDRIIFEGIQQVKDGDRIAPESVALRKAMVPLAKL